MQEQNFTGSKFCYLLLLKILSSHKTFRRQIHSIILKGIKIFMPFDQHDQNVNVIRMSLLGRHSLKIVTFGKVMPNVCITSF